MNLGYALSQGAAGAAQGVGVLADTQLKANADQVALNQKLDFNTREKAAEIMLNQRAAEYRMNQVKGYAAPVTTTTPGSPATPGVLANPDDAAYSELDGAAGPVADTPATAATPDTRRLTNGYG